jgi:hypothetical protein
MFRRYLRFMIKTATHRYENFGFDKMRVKSDQQG